MSHSPTIPVVTIKLNSNKLMRDEDDTLSLCSESSSSDSNYNFKNRYSSLGHYTNGNENEETAFVRLNRRSYSSLSQYNGNQSVRVNMNRSSPIYEANEEKSEDCQSEDNQDSEVTATYKLNAIKNRKKSLKENGKLFLRKSSTVIQCIDMNGSNEDESEESVSFSFKAPKRKKSEAKTDSELNGSYNGKYNQQASSNQFNGDQMNVAGDEKTDEQRTEEARKQFFIGKYKDIDEMLGNLFKMIEDTKQTLNAEELMQDFYEIEASAVKIHDNKALNAKVQEYKEEIDSSAVRIRENKVFSTELHEIKEEMDSVQVRQNRPTKGEFTVKNKLEDCTFQLYKCQNSAKNKLESDYYGTYLDLESTIDELQEEFEGFNSNRKNAILLRTQLSVRVHTIIEKLLNSSGRELRRALFSLKQIFQVDKDLVHEFVQNDGLACLVKVGCEADQNHQNYILRALGQVMLYVDGMNGVIRHNETIQWLYSLISSKYRLVVKTALKLLLVFVEYSDSNAKYLIDAIIMVDSERDVKPWYNLVCLLNEKELNDMELLILAMSLLNATLACLSDQDSYYDVVDSLEEQGMERIIQHYMSKQGIENDLLKQMHVYEAVLRFEDGDGDLDENTESLDYNVKKIINRKARGLANSGTKTYLNSLKNGNAIERRRSKRHALNCSLIKQNTKKKVLIDFLPSWQKSVNQTTEQFSKRSLLNLSKIEKDLRNSGNTTNKMSNGHSSPNDLAEQFDELTPGLRKRLNLRDLNKSDSPTPPAKQMTDNYELKNQRSSIASCSSLSSNISSSSNNSSSSGAYSLGSTEDANNKDSKTEIKSTNITVNSTDTPNTFAEKKSWMLSMMYGKGDEKKEADDVEMKNEKNIGSASKLTKNWQPMTTTAIVSTKEEISGSSIGVKNIKDRIMNGDDTPVKKIVPNYLRNVKTDNHLAKETEYLHWEQLRSSLSRPLLINDLDFTDLHMEDDNDICQLNIFNNSSLNGGIPGPPPLPMNGLSGPPMPPPPMPMLSNTDSTHKSNKINSAFSLSKSSLSSNLSTTSNSSSNYNSNYSSYSSAFGSLRSNLSTSSSKTSSIDSSYNSMRNDKTDTLGKSKKTLKLFWKEVKEDKGLLSRLKRKKTIWDEIESVQVDTAKLEHLFENRTKELTNKKSNEGKKNELILLDTKRSNAINIGMTKLPPPRTIKTAILKMDATIINREGIEKILSTMMPTEEEKNKITEAQNANPDIPLGNAESFLLMLSSITALEARLKLWAFRLDYDIMEREIAEQLFDLKKAIEEIESSQTFKLILGTLRSIGNFLNGGDVKGFQIDYLTKVPEVKDTVHKHSLLYHLAHIIIEKFPKSTDFYSEIGAVTRASKVDYDELARNITKLESDCKSSWEYLKLIAKHDGNNQMKQKMSEFLRDSAERIIVLSVIQRRVLNRFKKMVVFLGANMTSAKEAKPRTVLQIVSEFALEYRTTRERVKEQIEKKANLRERNKTRGKMITEGEKFNRSTLSHHTSTPALNTLGNGYKSISTTSLSNTTHSNFISKNTSSPIIQKPNELNADEQLRKILGNNFETETDAKTRWGNLNNVKRRPSVPASMLNHSPGYNRSLSNNLNHVNGGLANGDDEILENLVKNATSQNRLENKRKTKSTKIDRKSFRRTLVKNDLNLTEEEKLILANMTKGSV